ncbi:MAG TPA: tandem-95 repeat protein [Candidatus Limnocylindrales bacterium]
MKHPRLAVGLAIGALVVLAGTVLADLPSAHDQTLSTPRGIALGITLTGTATNGTADWQVDTAPAHGNLDVGSGVMTCDGSVPPACTSGLVTYTPTAGFEGNDSFTFTVHSDPDGTSGDGTISIAVGSAPVANHDPDVACSSNPPVLSGQYVTLEDTPLTVPAAAPCGLLANDTDADSGDTLTAALDSDGTIGNATVGSAGGFTYSPDANAHGDDTFSYDASDGTLSSQATVDVHVIPVNDVPSFTAGAGQTVLEDSGAFSLPGWATNLSVGPADEQSTQTLSVLLDSNDNSGLFSAAPAVSSTGTLTFTPAANANGVAHVVFKAHDNGGTSNGGVDTSAGQAVTITVTSVNDAPSFTAGSDPTVFEDSGAFSQPTWATAITAGPNEAGQSVSFQVTSNDNPGLFAAGPAVSASGTLTFTPAADAFGVANLTIVAKDSGNTNNGGSNTSAGAAVVVTVTGVNDVPSFTAGASPTVLEDSGAYSQPGWATDVSAGPSEDSQAVDFEVASDDNTSLFSVLPAVSASGTLTFTPGADQRGVAHLTIRIHDDGGTANGGVDTSQTQSVTITITGVNDPPSFTAGADPIVLEDSGAFAQAAWATNLSVGPNEAGQTLSFLVTADDNTALFSTQPAVSPTGTLSFTPAANRNGVAHLTIVAKDSGATTNGGSNTSPGASVTISVTGVNDAPSFTAGSAPTGLEDTAFSQSGWATAISAGPNESQTLSFVLDSDDNPGLFATAPAVSAAGKLTFTPAADASGVAHVAFKIHDSGGTANGGVDTSAPQSVTITVTAVNDAPSFTAGADPTVAEDSGAFSQTGWATGMTAGPADEQLVQSVTGFEVTANDNPGLFAVAPAVSASGTLTFTPGTNRNGVATITIAAVDDGGTANGGVNTSAGTVVTITVTAVNDPPTAVADTLTVPENAAATTVDVLANDSALPDAGEVLTIVSTPTAPTFGSVTIATDGLSLSYKPKAGYYGPDFFTYTIQDPGGLQATTHVDVTITKDTTAPTVGLPVEGIPVVRTMTSSGLAGTIAWTGSDAGVGIAKFELQRSVNGGAFTGVSLSTLTAKSYATTFTVGSSYQFRVRGTDKNGNVSAWKTGPTFVQARYQEASGFITYSSGWTLTSDPGDSGGAARYATVAGKSASFTHTMRDVAFVGPRSSTRGSFDVYVDGVKVGAAAMKTTTTAYGQVVWSYHFSKIGTHTIKVVLWGNGRVDLDCFVILT